ncbi:unnamed protein product [Malus baccata var. baccata]
MFSTSAPRHDGIDGNTTILPLLLSVSHCLQYLHQSRYTQKCPECGYLTIFDEHGVVRLITNPTRKSFEQKESPNRGTATAPGARPRVLVSLPTNQVILSYPELEQRLTELGWTRYPNSCRPDLLKFHRSENSVHLISFPKNFTNLKSFQMYDIIVKNRVDAQISLS